MSILDVFRRRPAPETRNASLTVSEYVQLLNTVAYQGNTYQLGGRQEEIGGDFRSLAAGAYQRNGVVFACMLVRQLLFSEARFQFRRIRNGRPGDLFGTEELRPLEQPWPGATTGDLLTRMLQDHDLAGNAFVARRGDRLRRLRPDWVTIVLGSEDDPDGAAFDVDADVLGYMYHPGGRLSGREPVALLPFEVAHFATVPDPVAAYRGMSWLNPVVTEIMADKAATAHKLKFFENGATSNTFIALSPELKAAAFNEWVEIFREQHEGLENAYKTIILGGGADAKVIGLDFQQMEFKATQGAGETRIAAAAGVPPVIVGLSEGLQAATYSNYGQARRRFADGTMRPLWRSAAGSLAQIIRVPPDAMLWYDDRDIPFLQEDMRDAAEIQGQQASTIRQLIDAGYEADSVVDAVTNTDWSRLKHSGLFSVQLQPPGEGTPPVDTSNGEPPPERKRELVRLADDEE